MENEVTRVHDLKTSFIAALEAAGGAAIPFATYAMGKLSGLPDDFSLMAGLGAGAGMGITSSYASEKWEPFFSSGYAGFFGLLTGVYNADTLQIPAASKPDYVVEADRFVSIASTGMTALASIAPRDNPAKLSALAAALTAATLATSLILGDRDKQADAAATGKPTTHQTLSLANRIPV
jgi:hypothetical protein